MTPGYSKILINESVLPDMNCPSFFAAGDINMMSIMGGKERTELEWRELIESVDLKMTGIWKSPYENEEGVIVAMLKD